MIGYFLRSRKILLICLFLVVTTVIVFERWCYPPVYPETLKFIHPFNLTDTHIKNAMENLHINPVYEQFNIQPVNEKRKVTVLVIVSSGPRRSDRRDAIRDTWWKECKPTFGVHPECLFFTDKQTPNSTYYKETLEESNKHKDLKFQPLHGGMDFGVRYLYQAVWAVTNYEFDYLLRLDDDYMFCLQRFMYELPKRQQFFHWGYFHKEYRVNRIDESLVLFSRDVIDLFLAQPADKLLCMPFADQMIGLWSEQFPQLKHMYHKETRVNHEKTVDNVPKLHTMENICEHYIGLHRCYSHNMRDLWKRKGDLNILQNITNDKTRDSYIGSLIANSENININDKVLFSWRDMSSNWRYTPAYCINKPSWNITDKKIVDGIYAGEQESKSYKLASSNYLLVFILNILFLYFQQDR